MQTCSLSPCSARACKLPRHSRLMRWASHTSCSIHASQLRCGADTPYLPLSLYCFATRARLEPTNLEPAPEHNCGVGTVDMTGGVVCRGFHLRTDGRAAGAACMFHHVTTSQVVAGAAAAISDR